MKMTSEMQPTVLGYKVDILVDGKDKDSLVVLVQFVNDDEKNIDTIAFLAARRSYPCGTLDIVGFEKGRWCPQGCWANPEQSAVWNSF